MSTSGGTTGGSQPAYTPQTTAVSRTANVGELTLATATLTVTAPIAPTTGNTFAVACAGPGITVTVQPNTGQAFITGGNLTLGGASSVAGRAAVVLVWDGAQWDIVSTAPSDIGIGFDLTGPLHLAAAGSLGIDQVNTTVALADNNASPTFITANGSGGGFDITLNWTTANAVKIYKRTDTVAGNRVRLVAGGGNTIEGALNIDLAPGQDVIMCLVGTDYKILGAYGVTQQNGTVPLGSDTALTIAGTTNLITTPTLPPGTYWVSGQVTIGLVTTAAVIDIGLVGSASVTGGGAGSNRGSTTGPISISVDGVMVIPDSVVSGTFTLQTFVVSGGAGFTAKAASASAQAYPDATALTWVRVG